MELGQPLSIGAAAIEAMADHVCTPWLSEPMELERGSNPLRLQATWYKCCKCVRINVHLDRGV